MKNHFIVFLLFDLPVCVHFSEIEVFSNRVVLTSTREDDPDKWFDKENQQFKYIGQLWISETRYIKAKIRQTNNKEKISSLNEDPDVEILRRKQEISWVEQEKFQTRITRTVDPEWPNLWYLNDEVSPSLKVSEAWNAGYSGKGVIIAVIDDGLQTDHPDISANVDVEHGTSFRDGPKDPNPKSDKDENGYIIVDQKVYTNEDSVGSLIKACYNLVNNAESLKFGRISSLKVSTANITNYELPDNTVEITNLTQTKELCSIYTTLSPCSSKLKCKVLNGKPSCVSKSSSSTVNKGAIIGGVLGGIATTIALAGAFYLHWKQRRQ